tara:strand:+ start:45 stop:245 length:201 start_codon:yes stop_codon:yes gene_type:complete
MHYFDKHNELIFEAALNANHLASPAAWSQQLRSKKGFPWILHYTFLIYPLSTFFPTNASKIEKAYS